MEQCTAYVGLDVHSNSVMAAMAVGWDEPVVIGQFDNEPSVLRRMINRLARRHGFLRFAYEAGPCGYEIYRQITALGHECLVAAPSQTPRRPGDRIKNDRRDAQSLARLLRSRDLTAVWVPDETHEAIRELVRCREDFKQVQHRCRQQLLALMLRHGRRFDGDRWTLRHQQWLREQRFDYPQTQMTFDHYWQAILEAQERIRALEAQMAQSLDDWSLAPLVHGLMAMRGITQLSAMTFAAELGDLSRFQKAWELMAFVGMVPSEHSSGPHQVRGGITKVGNAHVRRVLIETAWACRHRPSMSAALRARGQKASAAVRAIAWKAQKRLYARYHRLLARGKTPQAATTAVAREQLGFVWAIGQQVMKEQHSPAPAGI